MFYNYDKTCHYVDPSKYPTLSLDSNSFVFVDLGSVLTLCNKLIDDPFVVIVASMELSKVDCDECLFSNLYEKTKHDHT